MLKLLAIIVGLFGTLFPSTVIATTKRVLLGPAYENVEDLQARTWYVAFVRLQSILLVSAGILLVLKDQGSLESVGAVESPELTPTEVDEE
ncbi:MAG: hypothetical protein ACOCY6_03685 [Halodesulfurarchaeum sp.]